jgi:hypothetical protein
MDKKLQKIVMALLVLFCTVQGVRAIPLSGSYSINFSLPASATNFQTLQSAVDTLKKYGVSGPVTFNIASGIYSGQTIIPAITGASAANTITFQSAAIHPDSVTLNYSNTTNPVVRLDSAFYINFKFMSITTAAGRAFELTKAASYDTITNCKMTVGNAGIYATNLIGRKNVFTYNTITGGLYSVWLRGTAAIYSDSNVIAYNTMLNATSNGCNFYYTQYLQVKNNVIRSAGTVTALYHWYGNYAFIANNSIVSGGIGIDNANSFSQRFYANSISAAGYGISIVYNNVSYSNNEWRNNIIYSSGTSSTSAAASINLTGSSNNTWNYNAYYAKGANLFSGATSAYTTWRGTGQDLNSVVMDPGFVSTTDLHIVSGCKVGTLLTAITTDIEGTPRNNPPTMGAYEYAGTNNLTIAGLLKPQSGVITPGLQNLSVIIKNIGNNAVTSFNISYVLNGGVPVSQSWTGTLAPCDTVSFTFTGSYQMDLLSINKLTVYTDHPNAAPDSAPINDTLTVRLFAPLNGNYSIGRSGADFASFTEAVNALTIGGISAPVVFNAQNGIYTEQLLIPSIQGSSPANTITFQSALNNADSVTLRFSAATNIPIVKLDMASYISFRYITVSSLTSTGRGFELSGTASRDSIWNCKISAGNFGIYAAALTGGQNVFSYNTITGGATGLYLYGVSATVQTDSNIIAYNKILNATSYGCDLRYTKNLNVLNNTVVANNAMQIQYSYGVLKVIANVITGTNFGLYNYYSYGDAQSPTLIANNKITSSSANGTTVYNYQGANQRYYHNTISSANAGAGFDYGATDNNNDWKNNIIISTSTTAGYSIGGGSLGTNNTVDYNLYYTASGASPFTTFANLAAWQTAKGWDLHSLVANPDFVSTTDFHLKAGCKAGTILAAVTTDIEGNLRNTPPTMGAYEFSVINDVGIDRISQPEVGNTPSGLQDMVIRVKNTGANLITSFDISYVLNGGSPVTQSWSGGLAPCDTISVTFTGSNRINLGSVNTITVYTGNPNLGIDPNSANDTLTKLLYPSLNGTYTIGHAGANFISFNDAVTHLINGGVTGPVVFMVQTGTYTEQLTIPAIVGASATNTITFQSAANHADSVVLNYSVAVDEHIIKLVNANYINLKYITVASLSASGRLITIAGSASQDSITHCKISTGQMGLFANISGRKLVVSHNTFTGLSFGIYISGNSATDLSDSNIVTYNTIQNAPSGLTYGCYIAFTKNIKINRNNITGSTNGIYNYYNREAMEMMANKITAIGTTCNGIFISEVHGTAGKYALIANNSIISENLGISNYNGSYEHFYHNSINAVKSGVLISYDAASFYNEWKNNVIATQVSTGYTISVDYTGFTNKLDYNLYYNASLASPVQFYPSLASWQAGTGNDKHSVVYIPPFTSPTNLQPIAADSASWALNGRGIHSDSISALLLSTDINGNPRPTSRQAGVPDIGAYELTPTVLPPLAIASGSLMPDSTLIFISSVARDTVAKIKFWISSAIPGKIELRQYTGTAPLGLTPSDKFMYYYLDLKDSGSGGYLYDLTAYYNDAWLGTITTEQDLRLIHKTAGNPWNFNNSAVYSTVDTSKNILTDAQIFQFGLATGTDFFNPLPVKLLSFNARIIAKDVLLTWATASELNSNGFIIERSADNNTWNTIGTVKASGNTSSVSNYQLNDVNPFSKVNTLFYRLRMVDHDGSFVYSNTITVSNKLKIVSREPIAYPNPFNNTLTIELISEKEGIVNMSMMDITGKNIRTVTSTPITTGNNILPFATDDLQPGVYFLSLEVNGEKRIMKLIKQ